MESGCWYVTPAPPAGVDDHLDGQHETAIARENHIEPGRLTRQPARGRIEPLVSSQIIITVPSVEGGEPEKTFALPPQSHN